MYGLYLKEYGIRWHQLIGLIITLLVVLCI